MRIDPEVVPWSKSVGVAGAASLYEGKWATSVGAVHVFPRSVERATAIAFGSLPAAKRRHATVRAPVTGSIARAAPWLMWLSEFTLTGWLHVAPQSAVEATMSFVLMLFVPPTNIV